MGQVYLARTASGRHVVVKVIRPEFTDDPEFRARFAREAEISRRVGGFHTAQVVDAAPEDDPPWIATAFVPGPSLEQTVRENGPLEEPELTALALGLAEGLEAIHECGLVHRDLKPANILMAQDGPRIIDFGIARPLDVTGMTETGTILGTLAYMSPEQTRGEPANPASDMFSLGSVLAFAATGTNPFAAETMGATVLRIISTAPEVEELPDRLRPLIEACWDHEPRLRPAPGELITSLTDSAVETEDAFPSEQVGDYFPVSETTPTKQEDDHPGLDLQESLDLESPSKTKLSVFRLRPLVWTFSTVLVAGLIHWAAPFFTDVTSPPEVKAEVVVDMHEGMYDENEEFNSYIMSMEISPDGSVLATQDSFSLIRGPFSKDINRTYIRLWDASTGENTVERRFGEESPRQDFLFGPEGNPLRVEFAHEGEAVLHDIENREPLLTFASEQGSIRNLVFSSDGSTILTETSIDEIIEWDSTTGERLATHALEDDVTSKYTLCHDQHVSANQHNRGMEIWDTDSGESITTIDNESAKIRSCSFSPNEKFLATGSDDEHTQLWDIDTGELVAIYTTYEDTFYTRNFAPSVQINSVAFSPDGDTLATGRSDGDIYLWEIESEEHTLTLTGHEEEIQHVAFGADGDTLFAGGEGSMLRMWELG